MLTRISFAQRFASRALFGMVHLRALPGAPLFGGSMAEVIDAALADARALAGGGADGLVFENFGDRPFAKGRVEAETVAAMARVITEVVAEVRMPFGVNVLRNDAASAIAIAAATGASFIRVNIHTGAMLTDQGIIEGDAANTMRRRAALAPHLLVFADHLVKHAVPLAPVDARQSVRDLRLRGLADAIVVDGVETGIAVDPERLRTVREALPQAPLIIGSGLTPENADAYGDADAAIAGTSLKAGADVGAPVEAGRVGRLAEAFKRRGGR